MNKNNTKIEASEILGNRRKANENKYIVKSAFLGDKELKDVIWKIAENKAIREMGLVV